MDKCASMWDKVYSDLCSRLVLVWTAVIFLIMSSTHSAMISKSRDVYRAYPGDTVSIEWDIVHYDHLPAHQGYLSYRHGHSLLFTVHVENDNFNVITGAMDINHVSFSNPRADRYGVKLKNIRLEEAGVYSCTFKETAGGVESRRSNTTLFVYAAPDKPTIRPDGPILVGYNVTLSCVTQSHSQPTNQRTKMMITWYQDGTDLSAGHYSAIVIANDRMTLPLMNVQNKVHYYTCTVKETGSNLVEESHQFPIMLYALTPITRSISGALEGDDVTLKWHLSPTSDVTPQYDRRIVYTRNSEAIAFYDLRYYQWNDTTGGRLAYHNPVAGQYGITLRQVRPGDIGYYACAYQDEFGTEVTSEAISMTLKGHSLPTTTSTTRAPPTPGSTLDSHQTGISGVDAPHTLGSSDAVTTSGTPVALTASMVAICALIVTVVVIAVVLIRKKRNKKKPVAEPKYLLNRPDTVNRDYSVRYRAQGSVGSVYSELNESLMMPSDVIAGGPSLPPRDDTYNQPFEELRDSHVTDVSQIEDMYLTTMDCGDCSGKKSGNLGDCVPEVVLCNSLENGESRQTAEQNIYLTPIPSPTHTLC